MAIWASLEVAGWLSPGIVRDLVSLISFSLSRVSRTSCCSASAIVVNVEELSSSSLLVACVTRMRLVGPSDGRLFQNFELGFAHVALAQAFHSLYVFHRLEMQQYLQGPRNT